MKSLLNYLPKMRGKKIAIYGDLIADEYVYGTIHRFSREAPVFVVNYEAAQVGLGGAANAVNNIHELGATPYPIGVLGNDSAGRTLISVMREKGIPIDGVHHGDHHTTFVKQRVVAGSPHSVKQQILRIDRCIPMATDSPCHQHLKERALSMLGDMDALIVSDYGLGVANPAFLRDILAESNRKNIPCFVDSRHQLSAFHGITGATPNEPEVEVLMGKALDTSTLLADAGKRLLERLEAQALLITRGKNGMALFTRDQDPAWIPIFGSSDIVDVTGAGDTVVSTFTLGVAAGASFYDAARLANCAAGLAVMKRGAATVSPEELSEAIRVAALHESTD